MPLVDQAIAQFLLAKQADGDSAATLRWYGSLLGPFGKHFVGQRIETLTTEDVRRYIIGLRSRQIKYVGLKHKHEQEGGLGAETLRSHIRVIRTFIYWCWREYRLSAQDNPVAEGKVKVPRPGQRRPRAIEIEDVIRLLKAIDSRTPIGRRDRAIILFMLDTGCRAAGLVGLNMADVDLVRRRAILKEKGNKTRTAFFSLYVEQALRDWIAVRPKFATKLFCSVRPRDAGAALTPNALFLLLRRIKIKAKIDGKVNPHSFRHRFAKDYVRGGGDVETLRQILGHSSSTTTSIYLEFDDEELQEKHDKYSPIEKIRAFEKRAE